MDNIRPPRQPPRTPYDSPHSPVQPLKRPIQRTVMPPIAKRPLSSSVRASSLSGNPAPRYTELPEIGGLTEKPTLSGKRRPDTLSSNKKRSSKRLLVIIVALFFMLVAASYAGYHYMLSPVNAGDTSRTPIEVPAGSSLSKIGDILEEKGLIRSSFAFSAYIRLANITIQVQAGTYRLSTADSVPQIIDHLGSGKVDTFKITFLPGATLAENRKKLLEADFSEFEVDQALTAAYSSPLFEGKPDGSDLEGYIYGETYEFDRSATPTDVLKRTFDLYYRKLNEAGLVSVFKEKNMSLFKAITLASIIQRESANPTDQKQIAQIFLKRLNADMTLGSDVTYQYAARKLGVTPSPQLNSPYNTRRFVGLPPGPIAVPGLSALQAVATPAAGEYLFFVSGDNNVTYFAKTNEEHEANVNKHCHTKCLIP